VKKLNHKTLAKRKRKMNYPAASSGVSKTLNSVIPHLMRNPVRSSGFRLEFIPYLIRGRNDELAASGGEYNPKGFKRSFVSVFPPYRG
jgi:hypothetical protein